MIHVKNKVQEVRKAAGVTQKALAEQSGVPKRTIEEWEAQRVEPSAYKLYRVAKVLNCSMDDLIVDDEEKPD